MYSRPQSCQSIAIYSDPAPAHVMYSRHRSYQSIAIYSDPDPAHVLFTVIPHLPTMYSRPQSYQSIAIYSDPAPAQVVIGALKVTKASRFTVIPLLGFLKHRYLQ